MSAHSSAGVRIEVEGRLSRPEVEQVTRLVEAATAADGVGVASAVIDPSRVEAVRQQVPSLANRRPEAYRWPEEAAALAAGRLAV